MFFDIVVSPKESNSKPSFRIEIDRLLRKLRSIRRTGKKLCQLATRTKVENPRNLQNPEIAKIAVKSKNYELGKNLEFFKIQEGLKSSISKNSGKTLTELVITKYRIHRRRVV